MPYPLGNEIAKSKAKVAKLEHDRRVANRQERRDQERLARQRNRVIGELVAKYFPEVTVLHPGTQKENKVTFASVERFLAILSQNRQLVQELKIRASEAASAAADKP